MIPLPKLAVLMLAVPLLVSAPAVRGAEPPDVQLVRALAEQGNAYGQGRLGGMYLEGEGVPQDYAEAADWFLGAAERGHAPSQAALGRLYYEGEGVPQDYEKAAHWFRKAAEQGNPIGQGFLGFMYVHGQGVPQDFVRGYAWLNLAAADGLRAARKARDRLLEHLTPEQVAEGQALSRKLAKETGNE